MEKYTKEQVESAYNKIIELIQIVKELEKTFKGRHFTLDGHLIGSIGEVMASYYYGIELYPASMPIHDGITPDGREVQIKITQQSQIILNEEPDYLIVLHLNKDTGEITEVYNGVGKIPWSIARVFGKAEHRMISISRLLALDLDVLGHERITSIYEIKKYSEVKKTMNLRKPLEHLEQMPAKKGKKSGKTLEYGYINGKNQMNCGCTGKAGNHEGQMLYSMKCLKCGYEYEANGCDVWLRKCPKCR